jgi:hypothetical protein
MNSITRFIGRRLGSNETLKKGDLIYDKGHHRKIDVVDNWDGDLPSRHSDCQFYRLETENDKYLYDYLLGGEEK